MRSRIKTNALENDGAGNGIFDSGDTATGFRKAGVALIWLSLLVAFASSAYLPPTASREAQTVKNSFYVRTGQWLADLHTVANVFRYLMEIDEDDAAPP